MPSSLQFLLTQKKIAVCVGSGGVGKTTTAAALALGAARRGKKTLVLTIDPAKRLANSLGLAELKHAVVQVAPEFVSAGAQTAGGELHAMMLDQKAAFDEVVRSHASDGAAVARILANPLYAQISKTLAGAHEYAAMAKLAQFDQSGAWDFIVVDTPPTSHALDFLEAPERLTEAIDSPAIEWFRKLRGERSSRWSIVGKTGAFVLERLAKFVGSEFLADMSVFFTEFHEVLAGFKAHAQTTKQLLRQDKIGFVVITAPEPLAMHEAEALTTRLREQQMPLAGWVINKVHPSAPVTTDKTQVATALAAEPAVSDLGLSATSLNMAAEALVENHRLLEAKAQHDAALVAHARQLAPTAVLMSIPFEREDVHSLAHLRQLADVLYA